MTALDIACPTCAAQPGEPCVRDFATPAHPIGVALTEPHFERVQAALDATRDPLAHGVTEGAFIAAAKDLV